MFNKPKLWFLFALIGAGIIALVQGCGSSGSSSPATSHAIYGTTS